MAKMYVSLLDGSQNMAQEWNRYLFLQPNLSPLADAGWSEVLRSTYDVETPMFVARDGNGRIAGILLTYHHKAGGSSGVLYSSAQGLIADDVETAEALLGELRSYCEGTGIVRTIVGTGELKVEGRWYRWQKATLVKDVVTGEDAIWSELRKKTRYIIRRAFREGIKFSSGVEYLPQFYDAYVARFIEKRMPIHKLHYFESMFSVLGDKVQLYVAHRDGRFLSGMIFLIGPQAALYHYSASVEEGRKCGANHFLLWQVICDCIRREVTLVDLGESTPGGGVYGFKSIHFGGKEVPVNYVDVMRESGDSTVPRTRVPLSARLAAFFVEYTPVNVQEKLFGYIKEFHRLL